MLMSVRAHHNTKFSQPTWCQSSFGFHSLSIPLWCDFVVYNSQIQSVKPIAIYGCCIYLTLTSKVILPSVYTCIPYTLCTALDDWWLQLVTTEHLLVSKSL